MSATGPQVCGIPAYPMAYQQQHAYPEDQQNPTTSNPGWQYGQHPGQPNVYQQQNHQHPPHPSQPQQMQPQHPQERLPPRGMGPESQTAHWMNQHYMNGNWAYAASPVPSIAPSVISQSQYDDRMSMLSVNTAMTGHGQGDVESQRCFSSNGSTSENVNPDMAFAQLSREVEYILHNWFSIRDPIKRCEMAIKMQMWIRSKGLLHLDENTANSYIQQMVRIITDGLVIYTPPDTPAPQESISLSCRLLEVFHKLAQHKPAIPILAQAYALDEGDKSLRDLLCPFIPQNPDPRLDRCSYIVIEFMATVLQPKNPDTMKVPFLKAMKFPKMVHMLLKHLHEAPICNVNVLIILRNIISRDTNIKEYLIRFQTPKTQPLPPVSLIRVIVDCVIPRCVNAPQRAPSIISQTCHLLRTLLYDPSSINEFVKVQGINTFCSLLQRASDLRIARDVFNVFLHVSDSPAFEHVDVPLQLIMNVMHFFQNEDIFKLGSGFLSNIVANKPRYKKDAIQHNAIQLLDSIICKFPKIDTIADEKKRLVVIEIMSNCLRTLINLLPFWVQNSHLLGNDEAKNSQILAAVHKLLDACALKRYMNFLSFEAGAKEINSTIELRSYTLRFLVIIIKIPFISKTGIFDIVDDTRKESIVAHILSAFSWSCAIYTQPSEKAEKDQREKLIERCLALLIVLIDYCKGIQIVENMCRYGMNSPLDLIKETQNESFIHLILEFCEKVSANWEDITVVWLVDRPMMEGLANNRNGSIAKTANTLLSRMSISSSEPLADVFANSEFY